MKLMKGQCFSAKQLAAFNQDGFLIERDLVSSEYVTDILAVTQRDSNAFLGDIEYEADVRYPGAPRSLMDEGGRTIRRLRQAFSRDPVFTKLVKEPFLLQRLQQLLGPEVVMPLAHHNCVMTKHPQFSSDTGWHRDIRYWSFQTPELISAWIALGEENPQNGCLRLIPGSHTMQLEVSRLDANQFLRTGGQLNADLFDQAIEAELSAGDVLFFHANCFHSATRNYTDHTKYSAVFTFRNLSNLPLPGTRSAELPELLLEQNSLNQESPVDS